MYEDSCINFNCEELLSIARRRQLIARAGATVPEQQFLSFVTKDEIYFKNIDALGPGCISWGNRILRSLQFEDVPHKIITCDEFIKKSLQRSKPDLVVNLEKIVDEDNLVLSHTANGAPLVDHLRYRASVLPWWETQFGVYLDYIGSARSVDSDTNIDFKLITVGLSTGNEVAEFITWIKERVQEDLNKFSYMYGAIADTAEMLVDLPPPEERKGKFPDSARKKESTDSSYFRVPTALLIGGSNFMGVIKLPFSPKSCSSGTKYAYDSDHKIQPELLHYLNDEVPILTGFNIKKKLGRFQKMINLHHLPHGAKELVLNVFTIELEYLGYVAGIYNENCSLDQLNLVSTGGILINSTVISLGDLDLVEESVFKNRYIQLYLYGSIQAIFNTYSVFTMAFLMDGVTDIVAASQISGKSPYDVVSWFSAVLSVTTIGRIPDRDLAKVSLSRYDLMKSIASEDVVDRPLSLASVASLVDGKPSVVFAGDRYLHQSRSYMSKFNKIADNISPKPGVSVWKSADDAYIRDCILFNQFDKDKSYDWISGTSISASEPGGLAVYPDLLHKNDPLMKLKPEDDGTTRDQFSVIKQKTERSFRVRIMEWGMLNPREIKQFLSRVTLPAGSERKFLVANVKVVDDLKILHKLIFEEEVKVRKIAMTRPKQILDNLIKVSELNKLESGVKRKMSDLEARANDIQNKKKVLSSQYDDLINSVHKSELDKTLARYRPSERTVSVAIEDVDRPASSLSLASSSASASSTSTSSGLSKGQRKRIRKRLKYEEASKLVGEKLNSK